METINAKVPPLLLAELDRLIDEGWYGNRSEAIRDALRNLVERKHYRKMRTAIADDIDWALYGQ